MFRNHFRFKMSRDPLEYGSDSTVIHPLKIAEVNIQIHLAELRPGMH